MLVKVMVLVVMMVVVVVIYLCKFKNVFAYNCYHSLYMMLAVCVR